MIAAYLQLAVRLVQAGDLLSNQLNFPKMAAKLWICVGTGKRINSISGLPFSFSSGEGTIEPAGVNNTLTQQSDGRRDCSNFLQEAGWQLVGLPPRR